MKAPQFIAGVCALGLCVAATGRAPEGFKLKNGYLIRWGETQEKALAEAGTVGAIDMPVLDCATGEDCMVDVSEVPPPYHYGCLHFNDDRFYGVVLDLPADKFEDAEKAILAGIGTPPRQTRSTVQNLFGAQFDQLDDFWQVGNVSIYLEKRGNKVDEGMFTMVYDPLAPKRHDQPPAAPF
jgi:hypothetical protein